MTDLVIDRAVLTELALRLREGWPLPYQLTRLGGRVLYERPGMSALENSLFEHQALAALLVPLTPNLVGYRIDELVATVAKAPIVQAAVSELNRTLRGPERTPQQLIGYIVRLLAYAIDAEADVLLWDSRDGILSALLGAAGVTFVPADDGLRIGPELLAALASPRNTRVPTVWMASAGVVSLTEPVQVFISYAREDSRWHDHLRRMLRALELLGTVLVFSDESIPAGRDWEREITAALEHADAVVAFVSEYYLSSEFVMSVELPVILERVRRGEVALWWYLVTPCLYEHTALSRVQAAHNLEIPLEVTDPNDVGRLLKDCARGVAAIRPRR